VGESQSSTDALRRFAAASEGCRRREILTFFGEVPPFQQCGTCDLCLAQQHHTGDLTRDFCDEATLLLLSVDALSTSYKSPAMTAIKSLALQGKWPVPGPIQNETITQRLKVLRDKIKPERRSEDFLKASKC
jgi:superfamily II DNA helicase RecQ